MTKHLKKVNYVEVISNDRGNILAFNEKLKSEGGRIVAMTSIGSTRGTVDQIVVGVEKEVEYYTE